LDASIVSGADRPFSTRVIRPPFLIQKSLAPTRSQESVAHYPFCDRHVQERLGGLLNFYYRQKTSLKPNPHNAKTAA
jgi:hypothetical protein